MAWVVTPERLKIATALIEERAPLFDQIDLYKVADEIGIPLDNMSLEAGTGGMELTFTDLQTVIFAAALAAVVEAGIKQNEEPTEFDPLDAVPF